jgi:hypothetical protein
MRTGSRPIGGLGGAWILTGAMLLAAGPARVAQEAAGTPSVRRALLVGCDEYPALRAALPDRYEREVALRGPGNDVALLVDTLQRVLDLRGENVQVLRGWPDDPSARPTRANILAGLERLAREASAGDQVIVYLAGHGSQQRVQREKVAEEPDGLDEIFLPADVRPSERDQGHVPGALRDDELGERVRAIRDRGAEVWLIVDSCHSGTMLRGSSEGVRLRGLDPALLGAAATTRGGPAARGPAPAGWIEGDTAGIAALYGATSYGRAPEMELPRGAPDARPHGLFTFLLCQELERLGPAASHRELADRVIAAYQSFPCAITVPTAEGDLDRALAGGVAETPLVCSVRLGVPRLDRGRLAGLEPGAVAEVFEVERGVERHVARLEVTEADLFEARGRLIEGELAPDAGPWRARCEARPLGSSALALAIVRPDGSPAPVTELPGNLGKRLGEHADTLPLSEAPADADWWIVLLDSGSLWLRPGPREGGFDVCDVRPTELLEVLERIRRARNLRRFAGSSFTAPWQGELEVRVERRDPRRGWQVLGPDGLVHPGDRIRVRILKPGDGLFDVNVCYLDANFRTTVLPSESGSPRMSATTHERRIVEQTVVDNALGLESLLVFATPCSAASRELDLTGVLEQRGVTRGAASDPFGQLLDEALGGGRTRGAARPVAGTRGTQSWLQSLRTEWSAIVPPAWPARVVALERPPAAQPAGVSLDLPPPDPFELGYRAALARSSRGGEGCDLVLLGGDEVEVVLIDLDEGVPADTDLAELVGARAFEAEAAFLLGARRLAWYDHDDDGSLDLVLEDADGDGVAEVRWVLGEQGWRCDAPVALPWLSQGHVALGRRSQSEVSRAFQSLQGRR